MAFQVILTTSIYSVGKCLLGFMFIFFFYWIVCLFILSCLSSMVHTHTQIITYVQKHYKMEISAVIGLKIMMASSVQFSRSVVSDSLRPHELQHARPPYPSPTPGVYSNSCPSSWWCQVSHPLSSPSPPAPIPSQHQGLFQWVNSLHEVAKVLEFQLQNQSFQWTPRTDLL